MRANTVFPENIREIHCLRLGKTCAKHFSDGCFGLLGTAFDRCGKIFYRSRIFLMISDIFALVSGSTSIFSSTCLMA